MAELNTVTIPLEDYAELKPFYRKKKWKLGNSFGWWKIPYCPHCKRQLGLMAEEQKIDKCPMCNKPLDWSEENG